MSTYVVNSGRGLHLYYFLKEPAPLYKHYQKTLREFKETMIQRVMAALEPEVTEILLTKWLELKISGEEKK